MISHIKSIFFNEPEGEKKEWSHQSTLKVNILFCSIK
jgi:hypothetical protein